MLLGMSLPQTGDDGSRANIMHVAREAERIGLDSLWVMDRLLRPRQPVTRVPDETAQALPSYYGRVFDPLESLTFAAALTQHVMLGTSVINALFHPPVILARRFATLDQLSGGRAIAGLGQGWMQEEFDLASVPPGRRGAGMVDYVAAMRATWGPDPVRYQGRRYEIPAADIGPKPLQAAGIPVLIGAYAPAAIKRAATFADGFNPLATTRTDLARQIGLFRDAASEAGRDPQTLQIVVRANGLMSAADNTDRQRQMFHGSLAQWADDLDYADAMGIGHVFFSLDGPIDARLEAMAALRARHGKARCN